jgi:hypothetical protein
MILISGEKAIHAWVTITITVNPRPARRAMIARHLVHHVRVYILDAEEKTAVLVVLGIVR